MTLYYDPSLRQKLQPTSVDEVVLNQTFIPWVDHIKHNLEHRETSGGQNYASGADKELLIACQEHAQRFRGPMTKRTVVMFTHPFYLHLSHMNLIEADSITKAKDANEYLERVLHFLNLNKTNPRVAIVALETIHHYAAATSLLLEQGLIQRVLFTHYSKGTLLDNSGFKDLQKKSIFFAGGYNGLCLEDSTKEYIAVTRKSPRIISNLVIESPRDSVTLRFVPTFSTLEASIRITSLDKFMKSRCLK